MSASYVLKNENSGVEIYTNASGLRTQVMRIVRENNITVGEKNRYSGLLILGEPESTQREVLDIEKNIEENTLFGLCSELLSDLYLGAENKYSIYTPVDGDHFVRIDMAASIIGSDYDDAQIFYQDGYSGNLVSLFTIVEKKTYDEIASYGSFVSGEQLIYTYKDNEDKYTTSDNYEEEEILSFDPEILLELKKRGKADGEEYYTYSNNCWLESFVKAPDGADLTRFSEELSEFSDCIHDSIKEDMDISRIMDEILLAVKKQKESKNG